MELQTYIGIEQAKAQYQALPGILSGTVLISVATIALLWPAFSHQYLLLWFGMAGIMVFSR